MDLDLRKQPEIIAIQKNQASINSMVNTQIQGTNKQKQVKQSKFQQILKNQGVINALIIIVILLFIAFVFKLCCGKRIKDSRIIRGAGTGSSILASGSLRSVRISSLKSNHRHGMNVPRPRRADFSDSSSSEEDW